MKTTAFLLTLLAASAQAFVLVNPGAQISRLGAADDVDYDAPAERAAAVGNVVKTESPSLMGIPVPSFLAKAFGMRLDYGDNKKNDGEPLMEMDDECYLGKDGKLEECADFDPPSKR